MDSLARGGLTPKCSTHGSIINFSFLSQPLEPVLLLVDDHSSHFNPTTVHKAVEENRFVCHHIPHILLNLWTEVFLECSRNVGERDARTI